MKDKMRNGIASNKPRKCRSKGKSKARKETVQKTFFAVFTVLVMMVVPFSIIGSNDVQPDAALVGKIPTGNDYGYKLTTGVVKIGGNSGETIVKVEYVSSNGTSTVIYDSTQQENLLYQTDGNNVITKRTETDPNTNSFFKFDEKTGLGPFNTFYAAVNIGNTENNDHKTSTLNGQIAYILNPNNLKQAIVTSNGPYDQNCDTPTYYDITDLENYNIMMYIPTVYWFSKVVEGKTSVLWLSNKAGYFSNGADNIPASSMEALAHLIDGVVRPYLALGVYEASASGNKLVSQSGKDPLSNKRVDEFRDMAIELNNGINNGQYMLWNYYQWTLYKMMSYTVMGTKNSQIAIGMGVTYYNDSNFRSSGQGVTGKGDTQGAYWGGVTFNGDVASGSYTRNQPVKLFLENTWGSLHELLDDSWTFDGQLHAGHNTAEYLRDHMNPNASYRDGNTANTKTGSDGGLNDNQQPLNATITGISDGKVSRIKTTYTNTEYWDYPQTFGTFAGIGSAVQYSYGNQSLCVGGHYGSQDVGGLNRINIRNGFGAAKADIGTRLALVTTGGVLSYAESGEYQIQSDLGEISSGTSVPDGVTIRVVSTGSPISAVYVNGVSVTTPDFSFQMPAGDARLNIVVGQKVATPTTLSYVYDGSPHVGIYIIEGYDITGGTNEATNAGNYEVRITPKSGYTWLEGGGSEERSFQWVIEKKNLIAEGSSSADIRKEFDGNKNLGSGPGGEIGLDDLFLHGLVAGEIPAFTYTASYSDANAGTNKKINVTSLVLENSATFNTSNYVINIQPFIITGNNVQITKVSMADAVINGITDQTYTGSEITPVPTSVTIQGAVINPSNYTVTYSNNTNAGTATLTVTGKGNYESYKSITFKINKIQIDWPCTVMDYDGNNHSDDIEDGAYYTVQTHASGRYVGEYNATIAITNPNVEWSDSEQTVRTDVALWIRDVYPTVTYILGQDTKIGTFSSVDVPYQYPVSEGLVLPSGDLVSPYSLTGYDVEFVGWYETGGNPQNLVTEIPAYSMGDKSFTAKYNETPKEYTVTFNLQGKGANFSVKGYYNGTLSEPANTPTYISHDFAGWYKDPDCNTPWNFDTDVIKSDTSIFAKWDLKKFTVTWQNYDGTELEKDLNVQYNSFASYDSTTPTRSATESYTYTFKCWKKADTEITDLSAERVTDNVTYVAVFFENRVTHTVTFGYSDLFVITPMGVDNTNKVYHDDKFTFKLTVVDSRYSQIITKDLLSVKYSYNNQTLGFTRTSATMEDGNPVGVFESDNNILGDITLDFNGITLNEYTVTWKSVYKNGSGDIEETYTIKPDETIRHGTVAPNTYGNNPPITSEPEKYTYDFVRWTINGEPVGLFTAITITSNTEIVAEFANKALRQYSVSYGQNDVFTIVSPTNMQAGYGTTLYFDLVINSPMFSQVVETPRVKIYAVDNVNTTPTEADLITQGEYEFVNGKHLRHYSITNVTKNMYLQMTGITINGYTITWEVGNSSYSQQDVKINTLPVPDLVPTKSPTENSRFILYWMRGGVEVDITSDSQRITSDATYTAGFREVCDITFSDSPVIIIKPSNSTVVEKGGNYSFRIQPIPGTPYDKLNELSVRVGSETLLPDQTGLYTLTNVTGHTSVIIDVTLNQYSVTWLKKYVDQDDNTEKTETLYVDNYRYRHGISLPNLSGGVPSIDTQKYDYQFAKWIVGNQEYVDFPSMAITSDLTVTAVFNYVGLQKYTVSYDPNDLFTINSDKPENSMTVDYGDSLQIEFTINPPSFSQVISEQRLIIKTRPTADPNATPSSALPSGTPQQKNDGKWYNTFTIDSVTENLTLILDGISLNRYMVKWYDGETMVGAGVVPHGVELEAPEINKVGHTITDVVWHKGSPTGEAVSLEGGVTDNTNLYATYTATKIKYDVSLQQGLGYELYYLVGEVHTTDTAKVEHGDELTLFFVTTDNYTLDSFKIYKNGTEVTGSLVQQGNTTVYILVLSNVTENTSIVVDNSVLANTYTVTWSWLNSRQSETPVSQTTTVSHEYHPVAPVVPTKTDDTGEFTYTFLKWQLNSEDVNLSSYLVTGPVTFVAVFTETEVKHEVRTSNSNSISIESDGEHEVGLVKHNSVYSFKLKILDMSYSQLLTDSSKRIAITYKVGNDTKGVSMVGNYVEESNTVYAIFKTDEPVTQDILLEFSNITMNEYTVTWNYADNTSQTGSLKASDKYRHGTAISSPSVTAPSAFTNDPAHVYTFSGWKVKVGNADYTSYGSSDTLFPLTITGDTIIEAQYTQGTRQYTVSYTPNTVFDINQNGVASDAVSFNVNYDYPFSFTFEIDAKYSQVLTGNNKVEIVPVSVTSGTRYATLNQVANSYTEVGNIHKATYTIEHVTEDLVLDFDKITINSYTITWKDGDKSVTNISKYGTSPQPAFTPVKEDTEDSRFRQYWIIEDNETEVDLGSDGQKVYSDRTYVARFQEICDVNFPGNGAFDVNFENNTSTPVVRGGTIQFTITSDDPKYNRLSGLKVFVSGQEAPLTAVNGVFTISNITAHKTVNVIVTLNDYTVKYGWKCTQEGESQEVTNLLTQTFKHNMNMPYPGVPNIDTNQYVYTFDHWELKIGNASPIVLDPDSDPQILTDDLEYVAIFTKKELREFTVTYSPSPQFVVLTGNETGSEVVSSFKVKYGENFNFMFKVVAPGFTQIITKTPEQEGLLISARNGSANIPLDRNEEDPLTDINGNYYHTYTLANVQSDYTLAFANITLNTYTVKWVIDKGTATTDDDVLLSSPVKHGSRPIAPDTSTYWPEYDPVKKTVAVEWKQNDSIVDISTATITADVTYNAVFDLEDRKYRIVWLNYDGNPLHDLPEEVAYGQIPEYSGDTPTKPGDEEFTYTFDDRWSPAVTAVTGDAIYTAMYDPIPVKHTVTWKNDDGSIIEYDTNLAYNSVPSYDGTTPTKAPDAQYTYTFKCWKRAETEISDMSAERVLSDLIYTAVYDTTLNKYTVIWASDDGSVLEKDVEVEYGTMPSYDSLKPVKERTPQYKYRFLEWDRTITEVTGNTTYFATYASEVNKYTVTWKNDDGTLLRTEILEYGATPSYGSDPSKNKDLINTYTFDKWSPAVTSVKGDATYTAIYTPTKIDVQIDVVVSNGTYNAGTLEFMQGYSNEIHAFGNSTIMPKVITTIIEDEETGMDTETEVYELLIDGKAVCKAIPNTAEGYHSEFVGWFVDEVILNDTISTNGRDLTVTAKFDMHPESYSAAFNVNNGSEGYGNIKINDTSASHHILSNISANTIITVNSDSSLTIGGNTITAILPAASDWDYVFDGWFYVESNEPVTTGDMLGEMTDIYAKVSRSTTYYTVTWVDYDGTVLLEESVQKNKMPDYSGIPIRPGSGGVIYTFNGWSPTIVAASADATYTATYTPDHITRIVTVKLGGGGSDLVFDGGTWKYDSVTDSYTGIFKDGYNLDLGFVIKNPDELYNYEFRNWTSGEAVVIPGTVTADITYTAVYDSYDRKHTVFWIDGNGSIIDTTIVAYNHAPVHADPAIPSDLSTNYEFIGWAKNRGGVNLSEERIIANTTYRAMFGPAPYTVYFNSNGGSAPSPSSKEVNIGYEYGALATTSRDGFTFDGWFTQSSGGMRITPTTIVDTDRDLTLYAHWTPIQADTEQTPSGHGSGPSPNKPVTEVITNPDGSVTEKTTDTKVNKDGSVTHKVTEKTETDTETTERTEEKTNNTDGTVHEKVTEKVTQSDESSTEKTVETVTHPDGSTEVRTTDTQTDKDGHFTSKEKTEFSNGVTIEVGYSGDKRNKVIEPGIDVNLGNEDKLTKPQEDVVNEKIDEVYQTRSGPNLVIVSSSSTEIPRSIIDNIIGSDGALVYIQGGYELTISAAVLEDIGIPAVQNGLNIGKGTVPEKYRERVQEAPVYDISISVDSKEYHDNFAEPVKTSIPYQLEPGQVPEGIVVYFLGDEKMELLKSEYVDGRVVFYLPHMSLYTIMYEEPTESGGDNTWIYAALGILAAIAVVAVVLRTRYH